MDVTWIVTANAGRARVFSQSSRTAALEEIESMVNAEVRLRASDTESDQIGQLAASKSKHNVGAATQPSGYEPNQLPSEHQTELFARSIDSYLLQAQQEGRFQHLCLIAAPQFLGVLRKLLAPQVAALVDWEINKDYTHYSLKALQDALQAQQS
jgi:protein required for attachment to host cells